MVSIEEIFGQEHLIFFLVIIGTIAFVAVFHFLLKAYVRRITKRTKTDIDDVIVGAVIKPLHLLILAAGSYLALKTLPEAAGYLAAIDNAYYVVVVLVSSLIVARLLTILVSRWLKVQKKFEKTPKLISKLVTIAIYLIALIVILGHFNVEITPLVAALGLGGLAIGLALQNTLSNFFAGIHIISDRPVNVGDFIELEGNISGYVEDIGWRSTRIRTLPNTIVVVPNSKLAESIITNDSMPEQEMAALVQCGVSYGSDLRKVEKITVDVARKTQKTVRGAVKTFEPFIRYHTFGDSNINFTVILRVERFVDKYLVTHEFIKALKDRYDREGIEISWPVRKIYKGK